MTGSLSSPKGIPEKACNPPLPHPPKPVYLQRKRNGANRSIIRYILKSGSAVATKAGYEFELEYRVGDFFGELALLTPNPRAASIHARGKVVVLAMYRSQFMLLVSTAFTFA